MNFILQPWPLLLAIQAWASPRSADCPIDTPASRKLVPVHHTASRRADNSERPGERVKTESLFLFPSVINSIRGLDGFAFAPRGVAHRPYWCRSCRPTRFSGPTTDCGHPTPRAAQRQRPGDSYRNPRSQPVAPPERPSPRRPRPGAEERAVRRLQSSRGLLPPGGSWFKG
jgi:hypothetical protein